MDRSPHLPPLRPRESDSLIQIMFGREEDARIVNGVIPYKYPEVSESEVGKYYSCSCVRMNDFQWWIELGKEVSQSSGSHSLSFWCKCEPIREEVKDWKCYAELEFRLLPRDKDEEKVISWSLTDVLTPESAAVGFYDFEDWKCIRDTRKGYCSSNSIRVEVIVREMYPFTTVTEMPEFKFSTDNGHVTYDLTHTFKLPDFCDPDVLITLRNISFYTHTRYLSKFYLFRVKLAKQTNTEKKRIDLPDGMNLSAFLSIISLLYTNQLSVNKDNLIDLISCASVLRFSAILKTCILLIRPPHVLQVMEIALRDGNFDLLSDCWPVFCKDTISILYRSQFLKISKQLLKQILVQENMSCDELDLFLRSVDWSAEECKRQKVAVTAGNQRTMIGDALFNIRFPTMDLSDLKHHVKKSGILTQEERHQVKSFIRKRKGKADLKFPTKKRKSYSDNF